MAQTTRDIGDAETFTMTFTDDDGAAADPDAVRVIQRDPSGNEDTWTDDDAEVTNPAVGTWKFTMPEAFDESGVWIFELAGTEGILQAETIRVNVRARQVTGS